MISNFSTEFVKKLNALHSAGKFLEAVVLQESPTVTRYFVNHDRSVVFSGNIYQPLPMRWDGMGTDSQMELPVVRVTVPNIGGEVVDYVEKIDILENDSVLQVLHLDLLGDVNAKYEMKMQVQAVIGDAGRGVAQFVLGLNLAVDDPIPKFRILKDEFPGIVDNVFKIFV